MAAPSHPAHPRAFLIVQMKRIGDAILTTPLIGQIRKTHPDARITLALDAATRGLAPALGAHTLLIRGSGLWRGLVSQRFDICIDCTGNDRSALLTALSRAPRRITWQRFAKKPFRQRIYTEFAESSVRDRHTVDHHLDLLTPLGIKAEGLTPRLELPAASRDEASRALAAVGIAPPFLVVHAGTARAEKYWLPERWAEVITALRSQGFPVLLTGSAAPAEQAHLNAIQSALPEPCANLAGRLSLLGTAAVLERARMVLAVDSAPVHFADALGVPVVALFGPTNPFHWRPRATHSHIVTAVGSGPFTPAHPKKPMSEITASQVVGTVEAALAGIPRLS